MNPPANRHGTAIACTVEVHYLLGALLRSHKRLVASATVSLARKQNSMCAAYFTPMRQTETVPDGEEWPAKYPEIGWRTRFREPAPFL